MPPWSLLAALVICVGLSLLPGCADRQRRNPLDAQAESPLDLFDGLEVGAENGLVRLKWDLTALTDLDGLRIYRVGGAEGERVFDVDPSTATLTDEEVTNGQLYRYSLSMLVRDEGEVRVGDARLATPGPEISWLADRGSGLVWRLSPDGRTGLFAQGRFSFISAIGVDAGNGDCWVSDRWHRSLHRIDTTGEIQRFGTALSAGGDLVIDSPSRQGWVADRLTFEVFSFELDAQGDTLSLTEIDGTFSEQVELAAQSGDLWVCDPVGERVLLFDPQGARFAEWSGLKGLIRIDASANGNAAWVLADGGLELLRLEPGLEPVSVFKPFLDPAVALDVGDVRGDVWVAGATDVVAYADSGVPILHWDNVHGTQDISIDERNEHVWLAAPTQLWKVSLQGAGQTQLTGFSQTLEIVVHAGGG